MILELPDNLDVRVHLANALGETVSITHWRAGLAEAEAAEADPSGALARRARAMRDAADWLSDLRKEIKEEGR